ncbi:hypothetical protein TRFO_11213 [Tritrichomonas foetus]|uniref:Small-subunit processome Utp12 domain-containing protein n=1 Tax=Tritrichomonas foetus TaxID=1144522 RepID=A0A1J4J4V3_9EUKA|nr:hypothetical protein TRFO_11213 [Tritrichomonas foetus]|eukprot:OHS94350.1 hypothetical protein TRFO_11213 [Tritrichomonas foetus]
MDDKIIVQRNMEDENTAVSAPAGSYQIFEQAIKSGDESLIDFLLNKIPLEVIPDLIKSMQPLMINVFLRTFTYYIQLKPQSLSKALPWIEECIDQWQTDIMASSVSQKKVAELQHVLRQRTQQIGLFVEVDSLSTFVAHEKEGAGIGLPINDLEAQTLMEE